MADVKRPLDQKMEAKVPEVEAKDQGDVETDEPADNEEDGE